MIDRYIRKLFARGYSVAQVAVYRKPQLMRSRNPMIALGGRTFVCAIHKSVGFWMMAASIKRGQWPVAPCVSVIATYK